MGELRIIERIRARASGSAAVPLGIGDDCAILRPIPGHELLVTTDFSLEGRHFRREWHSARSVGHRTLARGLSDLAAMGARPLAAFLSLALPKSAARDAALAGRLSGRSARRWLRTHHVPLAGGDTAQSPSEHILADIVLLGSAPVGRALRRSGARAGDILYCTGALGGAAAELSALSAAPRRFRSARCRGGPPSPLPAAAACCGAGTAAAPARHGVHRSERRPLDRPRPSLHGFGRGSPELDLARLPLHPLAATLDDREQITALLHGGEDYELLFTAAPSTKMPRSIANVPITRIGRMLEAAKEQAADGHRQRRRTLRAPAARVGAPDVSGFPDVRTLPRAGPHAFSPRLRSSRRRGSSCTRSSFPAKKTRWDAALCCST